MISSILHAFQQGEISLDEASRRLRGILESPGGNYRLDIGRECRTGLAEVIYGAGKPIDVLNDIVSALIQQDKHVLVTRITSEIAQQLLKLHPILKNDDNGKIVYTEIDDTDFVHKVAILTAGSADIPVAIEACAACRYFGLRPMTYFDVGVGGIHRLMDKLPEISHANAIIVIAGMEGALPSVVNGLVRAPVIGVPTSVGYGASLGGYTALLAMLSSCSPGVSVVNIDNGVGAAAVAAKMLRHPKAEENE